MSKPWLSIAIPTYNRSTYLIECLDHLRPQIEPGVEIVICDNASTDETESSVGQYKTRYPFLEIRYFKNQENLGVDGNFLRCLRESRGNYVHLLSDDDILLPGSVERIHERIRQMPELAFIYLNSYSFQGKFKPALRAAPRFEIEKDIFFSDKDKFIEYLGVNFTFLSAIVVKKEGFDQVVGPEAFIGSMLLHCHVGLHCMNTGREYLIIAQPCIAARGGNSGGYNLYRVFAQEWRRVLFETGIRCGFQRSSMERVFDSTIKTFLRSWSVHMKINPTMYDSSKTGLLVRETWRYPSAWIYLYPFLVMPAWLVRWIKRAHDLKKSASRSGVKALLVAATPAARDE